MSTEAPSSPRAERAVVTLQHSRNARLPYGSFYGLKDAPFGLSSDPAFFYSSRSHGEAFDALLSGVRRRESLSVVSGDIGTGKTTLCRTVLKNLDRQTFSSFVPDPFATREDLLKVVLADFGVVSAEDLAAGRLSAASRTELSFLLYEFLGTLSPLQAFAVVFIDEAQNLSLPLLEEIRILADSDGRERQLQVVLVGQLELRDKLGLPEMRQVAQRVAVHCALDPLDRDGVSAYINHRLQVAGGSPNRVRFAHEVVDAIYEASGGIPRVINRLCDRALHHGHLRRLMVIDEATFALAKTDMAHLLPAPVEKAELSVSTTGEPVMARPPTAAVTHVAQFPAKKKRTQNGAVPKPADTVQRWFQRLKIAVFLFLIPGVAGYGVTAVARSLAQPVTLPVVGQPAPPAMPMALVIPPVPDDAAPAAQDIPSAPISAQ